MRTAIKTTTVLVLVLTLGLHWALLQSVAWTGMIIVYSQENSLRAAISMTFDGEHPCSMCNAIEQGRSEERRQNQQQPDTRLKLEFPLPTECVALIAPEFAEVLPILNRLTDSFLLEPPTPPPRPATAV